MITTASSTSTWRSLSSHPAVPCQQWPARVEEPFKAGSVLDYYKPYLDDRLWEENMPLGYKGSYQRVRAYLHKKRTSPRPMAPRPPSPRTVAGWLLRRPETLPEAEQLLLKVVRTQCPEIDAPTRHDRAFAVMLTERQGEQLPDWLAAVQRDDLPSLHTPPQASTATATPSSPASPALELGAVEGHANRIKMIKRQI
ncbi:hypothetical protein [Streptomyces sp. NPDC088785]|uniref:hypothetical protein n=1 Tax=Streptomyces sp. NPDC088785 TaxID=3365897 RepID=UPI0038053294